MKKRNNRLMWAGYANILRATQKRPQAAEDLVELTGVGILMIRQVMNRMHDMHLVRISGWEKRRFKGSPMALWSIGSGEDAPFPGEARPGRERNPHARYAKRSSLVAFAYIIRALAEPITIDDLAEQVGSTTCNIARLMLHCRRIGLVHIADWRSRPGGAGKPAMMLQLGDGEPNAPRPKRMSQAERNRRYRESHTGRRRMLSMISATAGAIA